MYGGGWNRIVDIKSANLTVIGHSRGGERTGFYVPQLKLFLDAGVQSDYQPDAIFITHCHTDHSHALPMLLTGISKVPKIYVPFEHVKLFENFVNASYRLSQGEDNLVSLYPITGVKGGETVRINDNFFMRIYNLDHTVPCRGYGLVKVSSRLKEQYRHMASTEIAELKRAGSQVTETIQSNILAYLTDTSISVFETYPELFSYQYIFVECTFIGDDKVSVDKHINWSQLRPYVQAHPNNVFVLIHFSARYTKNELVDFFKSQNLQNIIISD
jgi:ribonuclease Z